jgi:oxygen-independent coproporphyrinogen-3 oxidase
LAGIYISWPFCAQKCTYCNFASGVFPKELEERYAAALLVEFARHEWRWTPQTVFLGGGTPSSIECEPFESILSALPGRPWQEATIEAAPGSFTGEKIAIWRRAGINRVSLGVQSFVKAELARTGRHHDAETVKRDVSMLRAHGIDNINLDLIAGLPGQTEGSWRESLDSVIHLEVPHVSVYMLEVDDDSRLGAEILAGGGRYGAHDVPADDLIATCYEIAAEELARHGIHRYEISNFARRGAESLHNLKYWRREPYMGFGADAHSFDGVRRWSNVENAGEYADLALRGASVRAGETLPDALEEKFFVGLRLSEGVAAEAADWERYGPEFERFLAAGVMEKSGNRLRLTPRGIMVSNEIFQEFIAA